MRKLSCVGGECVACGVCQGACPMQAIAIRRGVVAEVDAAKCVGCGKCASACPAGVIQMRSQQGESA